MSKQRDTLRERLFYIDFLAFFTGQVTRRDLVERFGISEPAATKDLAVFAEIAPGVLQYDVRQKCYVLASNAPHFTHDVGQALYSLSGDRAIAFDTGHARKLPSWVMPSIKRKMDVKLVAALTRAMYCGRMVKAVYFSLEHGGDKERLLSPLAFVHDGSRWHLRCYSHEHGEYRDYNLARFMSVEDVEASNKSLDGDDRWTTHFTLELIPHPKSKRPETIRLDYDIEGDALFVTLPLCIAPYFLHHWRVDVTANASGSDVAYHLYLRNREAALASNMPKWIFREASTEPNRLDKSA
jgi:hypothetical protein